MKKQLAVQTTNTPTPATLLEKAIEKGVDMGQLKELMDLQERWEKKEAKKNFLDALSRFQNMVPSLKKGKTAKINSQKGNFSYKYADLGSITGSIKGCLLECGLSYRWEFQEANNKMKVTCYVSHRDGHTESTTMEAGLDASGYKNDIQQKGSTHTYLQRYTLIGALGLSTADEDNDAKGHQTTAESVEMTEDEILDQWKQEVSNCKTQVHLTSYYLKNKKTVDKDEKIKKIFKDREAVLKLESQTPTMQLP